MTKSYKTQTVLIILFSFISLFSAKSEEIDRTAKDFTLTDNYGKTHKLSDYAGKYVVLEWVNFGCPFVKKHYESDNIPKLQRDYTAKGIVWLSICSSATGKEGYLPNDEINSKLEFYHAKPTSYLIDEDGTVGKLYGAKRTPHMFIINPNGVLVYAGAIDDIASTDKDDLAKANNYVRQTLDNILAGHTPEFKVTNSYGCAVKYK